MSDLISRQAAIDAMMKLQTEDIEAYGASIPEGFDGDRAVTALKALPSAQQWISCEERLPKPEEEVLLTFDYKKGRYVETGNIWSDGMPHCYADDYLTPDCRKHRKVVAWMSLPEPWKGEKP